MANEKGGEVISVSTEAWNVADGYVKLKILKQLVLCDKLETIAIYGTEEIDQEGLVPQDMVPFYRVNAIHRLKDILKQALGNVVFAIRASDRDQLEKLKKRVDLVESMLDQVSYIEENQVAHTQVLAINEHWFRTMLNELQDIKEKINSPINNAGLIFRSSDQLSFDDMLKDILEGG